MKYLPTIDLWATGIQEAIHQGQLKLQTGQWVRCGQKNPSRWVGKVGNSLWVAHPQGTPKDSYTRFMSLVEVSRKKTTAK